MNLKCDESLVQLYVDGVLEPTERLVVGEHIRTCPACRRRAAGYKALFWDLSHPETEAEAPLPADLQALSDSLMESWEAAADARTPGQTAAQAAWDLSLYGLRASLIGAASRAVAGRVRPVAEQAGRSVVQRLGRLLLGKGVKRR